MIYSLIDSSHRITGMDISVADIQILLMTAQHIITIRHLISGKE